MIKQTKAQLEDALLDIKARLAASGGPPHPSVEDFQRAQQLAQVFQAHQLGLNIQAPAFKASLNSMIEFCGSWFTNVQGFDRNNFDGDCMLVVTELAEAVEADRKNAKDDHCPEFDGRAVELADALVRILHLASKYSIPLADAFIAKQAFNLTRPPKHGKGY